MALPISVPYSFANATTSIPLSQLDTDISTIYATVNGIGNGTVALSNVVITGGIVSNVSGISTSAISNGTSNVSISTANGSVTVATAGNTAMTVDTSQNTTVAGTVAMGSSFKRNRIINGNMLIDQRNAGASVTIASAGSFGVDRWYAVEDTDGTMTMQQSSTAPSGFISSMVFTTGSADSSLAAAQYVIMGQQIEGLSVYDLGWGTASAQSVTLSFWVRSSLTGTFGGALRNSAFNRSYPFNYSISSANTWEQKSVTIAGDTSGTWLTDTGVGVRLTLGLGVGSTYSGTAGSWSASNYFSATGATSVIGTAGATFYITGVQLEVGTKATPYEMQIYSDQLAQCQRYYQFSSSNAMWGTIKGTSDTNRNLTVFYSTAMRTSPTLSVTWSTGAATGSDWGGANGFNTYKMVGDTTTQIYVSSWTASAEL